MSFEKRESGSLVIYTLKAPLNAAVAQMVSEDLLSAVAANAGFEGAVLELKEFDIDPRAFKVLSPLGLELMKTQKRVYVLTEDHSVHTLIKQEGMDRLVKPVTKLEDIKLQDAASKKSPPKIDVGFLNPFIEGTIHVLKVQCHLEATPGKPLLKSTANFQCHTDIAGIIGITSKSFHGSIAICFPAAVFLKLMSQMLGEEYKEINDDLKDGAGELTNMIFGHAKKILNEKGHTIEKALPSVVRGPDLKIDHATPQDSIILPFTVDQDTFFMEIGIEQPTK